MSEPSHTTDQPTRHHSTNIAHPTAPDAEATGLNRLGTLRLDGKRIGLLLGLGMLTVVLLLTVGDGRAALAALRDVDWRLLLLAALIHYSGFAVRGHRWQQLLGVMGHGLGYLYTTTLLLAGWFVSALLPARAGDILRIGVLRLGPESGGTDRAAVPVASTLGSIVLERALDILAILTLGATFGFLALRTRLPDWVLITYGAAGGLLVLLGVGLLISPPLLGRLRGWFSHSLWQRVLDFVEQVVASLRALFARPGVALLVTAESLYIWLCDALLLWLVIAALGHWTAFSPAAFVALTVDIIAAVPVTPGGVGQIETAYAALLALLALPTVNIAAVVLLTRLISYWSFLVVSGVATFGAGFGAMLQHQPNPTRPVVD